MFSRGAFSAGNDIGCSVPKNEAVLEVSDLSSIHRGLNRPESQELCRG